MRNATLAISMLSFGNMFTVLARSMCLPFLAIYFAARLKLSPNEIGFILGCGALAGIASGFLGGYLSDIIGRKKLVIAMAYLLAVIISCFYLVTDVVLFLILNILLGFSQNLYEPLSKGLLADFSPQNKRLANFANRYVGTNIGFAVGPLVGMLFAASNNPLSFIMAAVLNLLYAILLHQLLRKRDCLKPQVAEEKLIFKRIVMLTFTDKALCLFIVGGILTLTVHGEMSITLSQYLTSYFDDGTKIFAWLMSTNAIVVVLMQKYFLKLVKPLSYSNIMVMGCALLFCGELGFSYSTNIISFILSMMVFTFGEILIIPTEYILIDYIAPEYLRGTYYGAYTLTYLGNFIGPWLGGYILEHNGGRSMFMLMGVLALLSIIFFIKGCERISPRGIPNKI